MKQFTVVIIKPDAVDRGIVGQIITRLENKGIGIEVMASAFLEKKDIREMYKHIKHLDHFEKIVDFMSKGLSIIMVVHGEDSIAVIRRMIGSTFDAVAGTIRGDFGVKNFYGANLIHCSDSDDSAKAELDILVKYFVKENIDNE